MKRRSMPSPAMVVACIALFVAMGGTGYAAGQLAAGQDQAAASKGKKAQTGKRGKRGKPGKPGKPGAIGPQGEQGGQGGQGPKGDPGTPAPIGGTLPAGKTVIGAYAFGGRDSQPRDSITYGGYVLSAAPTAHYIKSGDPVPVGCTDGTVASPKADPGHLCIYEGVNVGSDGNRGFLNPTNDSTTSVLAFGAGVYGTCAAECRVEGTWAVTGS